MREIWAGRRGATLVELMIGVASALILAAVVVPIYGDARERTEYARAAGLGLEIATALEAYAADNSGKYPPSADRNLDPNGQGFHARLPSYLTTPVAYLTELPHDPFLHTSSLGTQPQEVGRRFVYYNTRDLETRYGDLWGGLENWLGPWQFFSVGPDRTALQGHKATLLPYDPTNGTFSTGNIIRCVKHENGVPPHPTTNTYFWP